MPGTDCLKQSGRPLPSNDLWIAALARQHRLPLLSRDGHFDFVSWAFCLVYPNGRDALSEVTGRRAAFAFLAS